MNWRGARRARTRRGGRGWAARGNEEADAAFLVEIPDRKIEGIDFFSGFEISRARSYRGIEWDLSISSEIGFDPPTFEAHRCENRYALDPALKLPERRKPSLKLPNEARFALAIPMYISVLSVELSRFLWRPPLEKRAMNLYTRLVRFILIKNIVGDNDKLARTCKI